MRRRLRRSIASAINKLAHQESLRRYEAMVCEMRIRAQELLDVGMEAEAMLRTIHEEFCIGPEPDGGARRFGDCL